MFYNYLHLYHTLRSKSQHSTLIFGVECCPFDGTEPQAIMVKVGRCRDVLVGPSIGTEIVSGQLHGVKVIRVQLQDENPRGETVWMMLRRCLALRLTFFWRLRQREQRELGPAETHSSHPFEVTEHLQLLKRIAQRGQALDGARAVVLHHQLCRPLEIVVQQSIV